MPCSGPGSGPACPRRAECGSSSLTAGPAHCHALQSATRSGQWCPAVQARAQERAQAAHAELETTRAALQQAQRSAADGQAALQQQTHQLQAQLREGAAHAQALQGQLEAARQGEAAQLEAVQRLQAQVQELEGEAAARGQRVAGLERDLAELQVPSACMVSLVFVWSCVGLSVMALQQNVCEAGGSSGLEWAVAEPRGGEPRRSFMCNGPDAESSGSRSGWSGGWQSCGCPEGRSSLSFMCTESNQKTSDNIQAGASGSSALGAFRV